MSASWPGSMRGPRLKTLLFLLLLLLSTLSGTVLSQYDDEESTDSDAGPDGEAGDPEQVDGADTETLESDSGDPEASEAPQVTDPPLTDEGVSVETPAEEENGSGLRRSLNSDVASTDYSKTTVDPNSTGPTSIPGEEQGGEEGLSPIIILIPVVLVVVIISMIVCGIFINRKWNKKAKDQELRKEDPYLEASSTEKVPMPMFEDDVPSVLELEMEELDQWIKEDGETAEETKHV